MTVRLLLVDDSAIVRETLRLVFGSRDVIEVVGEATDGAEGIRLARALRPDVVLMTHAPARDS